MKKQPADSKKRVNRRTIAGVLTVIYVLILFAPLVAFATHSNIFTRAVHGECSGNCEIDGCSLENRANHTCCCAQKKQHEAGVQKLSTGDCCAAKAAVAPVTKGDCCAAPMIAKPVVVKNDCCSKGSDKKTGGAVQKEKIKNRELVYKCGNRCGTGKQFVLAAVGTSELLPYVYSHNNVPTHEVNRYYGFPQRMISRHSEPPDPPPRLFPIS